MFNVAELARKFLLRSLVKKKGNSLRVALTCPKHGNEGKKQEVDGEEKRKMDVGSDQGESDRHLTNTAQCPCCEQIYSTGRCTYRQTVLE